MSRDIWLMKNNGQNNNVPDSLHVYERRTAGTGPQARHALSCSQELCEIGDGCYFTCFKCISTLNVRSHAVRSLLLVPTSQARWSD